MAQAPYQQLLDGETDFHLRRAVERLREGLFDPVAVRLLTAHEDRLSRAVERGFGEVDAGKAPHLCICGAYGQGKSHSLTYIQDRALAGNFATSMINLDPREIPFHDLRQVYRALVAGLRFPDSGASLAERWRGWVAGQLAEPNDSSIGPSDLLPAELPHLFRSVLVALAQKNLSLTERQRQSKKHAKFRPRDFPYLLSRVLAGETISVFRLRHALKYRQVPFYMDASLVCRGTEPYLQMIRGLARLFRRMGYRGWVLLFDEGEAISQVPVPRRSRSYELLHRFFAPEGEIVGLFPVFAFTDDFFQRVEEEDYERTRMQGEEEIPYFPLDYSQAWRDLNRYRLQDLSAKEWSELIERLIHLHARAYGWNPPGGQIGQQMSERLTETQGQETRFRLKALVDQLDLVQQQRVYKF